jgi:hypothetical protein
MKKKCQKWFDKKQTPPALENRRGPYIFAIRRPLMPQPGCEHDYLEVCEQTSGKNHP